ncbi:AMP-binding protein [Xenorhabdus sp. DI]|uniref:class I adenylate-forming enzyme family protein n=1 Tax=Xenorhabdus doucetiae TaxID=351671 RepID=UPI0019AC21BF|nr:MULTISPECIES: long-chain fatty acid--CoA ligase [unclassified Xenorhabdus]MBD2784083.1 AMP-binding protein [Xenorhabdus sp. 3]MBD2787792.1 AMP-binding protein [Xenorhabdus sp. DI]
MGIREHFKCLLYKTPDNAYAIEHFQSWWTWAKLRSCAHLLEESLKNAGVGSSERVGLILENRPEHVATLLKLLETNRTVVVLSSLQPTMRLIADIQRLKIRVLIGSSRRLQDKKLLIASMANTLVFELNCIGETYFVGGKTLIDSITPSDIAIEMPTSGTTGIPKQIKLSYQQIENALIASGQIPKDTQLLTESVSLISMPIFHISGLWGILSALYTGRKIVLMSKFVLEPWVEVIERYKIRATFLVPAALHDLLNADIDPTKINSLKVITSGSTYCPPKLIDQILARYGIRVLMTYGATEFAGAVAGWDYKLHKEWWTLKSGSSGKAYPGIKLRITNEFGHELPIGQSGYLEVCTVQTTLENKCRWVRTSDLANIDADGFLWVLGRTDNIIMRGGFKIQPEKIKNLLETHPLVKEATVTGIPDIRLNSLPVAIIEAESKQCSPTVNELICLCHSGLLPYEIPKHILIVDKLPRTATGKINHTELLNLIEHSLSN